MPPIIRGSYARKIQSKKGLNCRGERGFTQRQTGRGDETAVKGSGILGNSAKRCNFAVFLAGGDCLNK